MVPRDPITFHLITVCNHRTATDGALQKLLDSLSEQKAPVAVYLVAQGVPEARLEELRSTPVVRAIDALPEIRPAAWSRNQILQTALSEAADHDVIAFPDDDCWYAPATLAVVARIFSARPETGLLLGRIDARPDVLRAAEGLREATLEDGLYRTLMGSLFVRADVAKRTGALDDRFGLGTDIGSAEEVDYALRMMRTGVAALYAPNLYVGHPVKPSKQVVYWRGNLAVLAKHVGAKPIMWWRLWLRAARGIKFVLGGKMSLPYWFVSLAKAVPFLPLWRSSPGRFLTGH